MGGIFSPAFGLGGAATAMMAGQRFGKAEIRERILGSHRNASLSITFHHNAARHCGKLKHMNESLACSALQRATVRDCALRHTAA